MPTGPDQEPTDKMILSWWIQAHGEHAELVTPEMARAYTLQVINAEKIARFDAHVAELLTPSEWAYIAERLPLSAPPAHPREDS